MHVEYEDSDWMAAFNLNLSVASMYELLFNWFGDSDSSCVQSVVYGVDGGSSGTSGSGVGSGSGGSGAGFSVVSSVQDGFTPVGVTVDDRRELYFNSGGGGESGTGEFFVLCCID